VTLFVRQVLFLFFSLALAWPVLALAGDEIPLALREEATQGGLLIGKTVPGGTVEQDGRSLRVSADGLFLLGVSRDAKPSSRLRVTTPDGRQVERTIQVAKREYRIQRIDGLPKRKVTPTKPEDLARIRADSKAVKAARKRDDDRSDFLGEWLWPVTGRISGVYGSQRILNGKPKRPHFGVDIAAPAGTPIVAPADGVVTLLHPDMFYSGVTLLLDHGHGLSTVYLHMKRARVREGQRVERGEVIGEVGMSGRATGPHLHWGMNLFDKRLDPALMVGPMPNS
jgi:murein DD-endopeptidase MepM/ murein hydrolase activator NlpD